MKWNTFMKEALKGTFWEMCVFVLSSDTTLINLTIQSPISHRVSTSLTMSVTENAPYCHHMALHRFLRAAFV